MPEPTVATPLAEELAAALEPLCWPEFTLTYPAPLPRGRYRLPTPPALVEVRCMVRASSETLAARTDVAVRAGLFATAQDIIATAERLGWHHDRAPRIVFDGRMVDRLGQSATIVHDCEVRMALAGGPA